jgi:hypothetical protein
VTSILPQKLGIDRLYVTRRNLGMDLRIMFWTFVAVFLRRPVAVNRSTGQLRVRRRPRVAEPAFAAESRANSLALAPTGQEVT